MLNQSDIYHDINETAYNAWLYDNLNPDEVLHTGRYPARQRSTLAEIMQMNIERREVDEAEQERLEDEYLKRCGV